MSPELRERINAILEDPHFLDRIALLAKARAAEERGFATSETFQRMLMVLRSQVQPVHILSESFAYYPDKAKAEVGWDFASDKDVGLFFSAMADTEAATVAAGSYQEDKNCPFPNYTLINHGFRVSVMTGQGLDIRIASIA